MMKQRYNYPYNRKGNIHVGEGTYVHKDLFIKKLWEEGKLKVVPTTMYPNEYSKIVEIIDNKENSRVEVWLEHNSRATR